MIKEFFSRIASFFRSGPSKPSATEKRDKEPNPHDTDEVALKFYEDLLDAESKRKR